MATIDIRQGQPDGYRCGNCIFWELSGYAESNQQELGVSGYSTDGRVSNCRRHAPAAVNPDREPGATAVWPTTNVNHLCGDWKWRYG